MVELNPAGFLFVTSKSHWNVSSAKVTVGSRALNVIATKLVDSHLPDDSSQFRCELTAGDND